MGPTDDEIAAMRDPVLRNLWITQRYHQLAVDLRAGGFGEDATWCAFAVWASKSAGATIRGEELPARVRRLVTADGRIHAGLRRLNDAAEPTAAAPVHPGHLADAVGRVTADVAAAIAAGNALVFAELAPRFAALASGGPDPDDPEVGGPAGDDGLAGIFARYRRALAARPEDGRAALVLAANVAAVAHEQRRLQPAIRTALDAAVRDEFERTVADAIARRVASAGARRLLARLTADVGAVLDGIWQTAVTELLMRLVTADERLDLRRDVPPLGGTLWPAPLADLAGTEADAVVARWDRTGGRGAPTGAHDWAVIEERMNYIVTLFRSRQRHPALLEPPYTPGQLSELGAGRLPPGPL